MPTLSKDLVEITDFDSLLPRRCELVTQRFLPANEGSLRDELRASVQEAKISTETIIAIAGDRTLKSQLYSHNIFFERFGESGE